MEFVTLIFLISSLEAFLAHPVTFTYFKCYLSTD